MSVVNMLYIQQLLLGISLLLSVKTYLSNDAILTHMQNSRVTACMILLQSCHTCILSVWESLILLQSNCPVTHNTRVTPATVLDTTRVQYNNSFWLCIIVSCSPIMFVFLWPKVNMFTPSCLDIVTSQVWIFWFPASNCCYIAGVHLHVCMVYTLQVVLLLIL